MNSRNVMRRIITLSVAFLGASALSGWAADAKALYEKDCAKCHGADGKGDTKMGKTLGAKDYTDAKVQAEQIELRAPEGQNVFRRLSRVDFGRRADRP